ncbi:hypothetical protein IG631_07140 [Alternaria alternata]|nr:hypothetical protein IG631_07140 [Alternaria alternata]
MPTMPRLVVDFGFTHMEAPRMDPDLDKRSRTRTSCARKRAGNATGAISRDDRRTGRQPNHRLVSRAETEAGMSFYIYAKATAVFG